MTALVNIDVLNPDSTPWAYATVAVRLVDAGAGGVTTPGVIAGTQRVRCDSAGHAEIALTPNASITPANTFYAFTVERSSPSVTRKITVPVSPSEIDWDDGAYQVITDTPPVYFPAATSGDVGDVPRVNATGDGYELAAPSGGAGSVADDTHAATSKTTPVNADELPLVDSAASFGLKKLTWANLKATLKTYFDTLYPSGSGTSTGTNTGDQTLPTLSSLGAVPTSRTLAGLDLSADRTASALRTALGLVIGTDVLAPNGSGASLTGIPESAVTNLVTDLAAKAPLASPTFTGTPAAPTAATGTNTTQLATAALVVATRAATNTIPHMPLVAGLHLGPPGVSPNANTTASVLSGGGGVATSATYVMPCPIWVPEDCMIDALCCYQSVAATDSGSTIELALGPISPYPWTGTYLFTAGTTSATAAAGLRTIGFTATAVKAGLHWAYMKFTTTTTAGTNPSFMKFNTSGAWPASPYPGTAPAASFPTSTGPYGSGLSASAAIPSNLTTPTPQVTNNGYVWITARVA